METDALVRAVIAGDRRAWPELYRRLHGRLRDFFQYRLPGAPQEHEDLIQNTLAAVVAKLDKFEDRGESAFIRWVHGFAWIELRELLRRRKREGDGLGALAREPTPARTGLSSRVDRQQRLELVLRMSEQLAEGQRRAIDNQLDGGDAGILAKREKISRGAARMIQSLRELSRRTMNRRRPPKRRAAKRSPSTPTR